MQSSTGGLFLDKQACAVQNYYLKQQQMQSSTVGLFLDKQACAVQYH